MNQRTLLDRLLTPAGFGLALLLFLIPFATVSCGVETGRVDATFTGLDLIVGGQPSLSGPSVDAGVEEQLVPVFQEDYEPEPLVIVAAIMLLIGMAVAVFPRPKVRALASAGVAVVTVILLAAAVFLRGPGRADAAMDRFRAATKLEEDLPISTSPAFGFWIVVFLLLALAGWQVYEATRQPAATAGVPAGPPGGPPPEAASWPQPGAPGGWTSQGPPGA